jgi:Xaa-Pro aminopeptidase
MRLIPEKKIEQFREELKKKKVDVALFLTSEPMHDVNVEYFTGFQQVRFFSFSCLLIFQDNSVLIVSPLSYDRALEEAEADEIINLADYERSLTSVLKKKLKDVKTVGIVEKAFPLKLYKKFKRLKFIDISDTILELRSIKEEKEIGMIKKACKIANHGIKIIERNLSTKMSERELASILEQELLRKGADEIAFPTIVTSGRKSAFIHPFPSSTNERIKTGLGLVDFGVRFKGYCSDVTVPFSIGRLSKKQKKIVKTVEEAYRECLNSLRINIPTWKVHERVEKKIEENGFEFKHSSGHGLGLELHDLPSFSPKPKNKEDLKDWKEIKLKKNMTFTIEPGVYEVGVGGCRLENDVLMKKKPVLLTNSSFLYF